MGQQRLDEKYALDGYVNFLTGLGDFNRDKTLGGQRGGPNFCVDLMSGYDAENRWRGSDLGGRIVETIPDEMTREGFEIQVQPSDDDEDDERDDAFPATQPGMPMLPSAPADKPKPLEIDDEGIEIAEEVDDALELLGADEAFWYGLAYERCYGGGAILLGVDDGGQSLEQPLDEERVGSVNHLTPFWGGWDGELVAWSYYRDPTKPNFGMPEMYMLRNLGVPISRVPAPGERPQPDALPVGPGYGPLIYWIHESRLLIFPGMSPSRRARVQMRGWGDSVFVRVEQVLQQFNQTWQGLANLMTDWSQGVLAIENFSASMAANNKAATQTLAQRAMGLNVSRSIARMMVIDAKEKFSRETTTLAGLDGVLEQFALRLAAAADMPVSLLMGQAPAGLNATGDSEIRWFYDRVKAKQRKRVLPPLRKLIRLLLKSKQGPTKGAVPQRWSVQGRPLYQMSAKERAERYLSIAQADQIYMANSVVTAEEVGATRFGGAEYNDGPIVLDLKGRADMAAQDEADKAARDEVMRKAAAAPPTPPAAPPEQAPQKQDGAGADVAAMMAEDFPQSALTWMSSATWEGPQDVPAADVDYADEHRWRASAEPGKVEKFKGKIQRGKKKPIVLARPPSGGQLRVVDGHHRALAYRELGAPVYAYVANFDNDVAYQLALQTHGKQYQQPAEE